MNKKTVSFAYVAALMVLAIVLTVLSVLPVVTVDTTQLTSLDKYYDGQLTSTAKRPVDPEASFGLSTAIAVLTRMGDIATVVDVQQQEMTINDLQKELTEAEANNSSDSLIESLEERLEDAEAELVLTMAQLGDEELDRLTEQPSDPSFMRALDAVFVFMSLTLEDIEYAFDAPVFAADGTIRNTCVSSAIGIFSLLIHIGLIAVAVIYPLVLLILCVVKLIGVLRGIVKGTDTDVLIAGIEKFSFAGYPMTMLILYILLYLLSPDFVSLGGSMVAITVIWALASVLHAAKEILSDRANMLRHILKKAIAAASVAIAALLIVNFCGLKLISGYEDDHVSLIDTRFETIENELLADGEKDWVAESAASDKAREDNARNFGILFAVVLLCGLILTGLLVSRAEHISTLNGSRATVGGLIALSIVLVVIAALPMYYGVDSFEEKTAAFEKGDYKICYTEYIDKDSTDCRNYEECQASYELLSASIEELTEAYDAEAEDMDEDTAYGTLYTINRLKAQANLLRVTIEDYEQQESRAKGCMVVSILAILLLIADLVVEKVIPAKTSKSSEESTDAEAGA